MVRCCTLGDSFSPPSSRIHQLITALVNSHVLATYTLPIMCYAVAFPQELGNEVPFQTPTLNPYYPHLPISHPFQHAARPPADRFPPWVSVSCSSPLEGYRELSIPFFVWMLKINKFRTDVVRCCTLGDSFFPPFSLIHQLITALVNSHVLATYTLPIMYYAVALPQELGSEVPFQTPALNPYYPHLPMSRPFQHAARPPADRFPPWVSASCSSTLNNTHTHTRARLIRGFRNKYH